MHLRVFNGLKGSAVLIAVWGATYYFLWFSVISNPKELGEVQESVWFNTVSGTVYTVPTFFFCSGFLQTLSFLQRDEDESMFTPRRLGLYYARKFLRYIPLNLAVLLGVVYVLPHLGNGPVWNHFATLTDPCKTKWWANLLWLGNLVPASLDDKCLPWTWFLPCYVQLSLLLPPLIAIYKYMRGPVVGVIYGCIGGAALVGTFLMVLLVDRGATLAFHPEPNAAARADDFFSWVFMNPLYHFSSFFLGMLVCLAYVTFKEERAEASAESNSLVSRALEMVCHNAGPRYALYLLGLGAQVGAVLWQTPFVAYPADQSAAHAAFYATLAYPFFCIGLSTMLLPALAGKAAVFRYLWGSQTWTMLCAMGLGLYLLVPVVALFYYMSAQHQISVTYYMQIYYWTGHVLFATMFWFIIAIPLDRPISALLNLKADVRDAEENEDYKLEDYLENFRETELLADLDHDDASKSEAGGPNAKQVAPADGRD